MSLRTRIPLVALALGALAVAGCGGSSGGGSSQGAAAPPTAVAHPQDFPKGKGLSYQDVRSRYPQQLAIGIGASVMRQGANRIPFLVLDQAAHSVTSAPVALYVMHTDGTGVRGPFLARETSFDVKPPYVSRTTASDPDQHPKFYVSDIEFHGKAPQAVFGLVRMDGRLVATSPSPLGVKLKTPPPDVGQKAIRVHTKTVHDVPKVSQITTRVPPDTDLLQADFADVLGKKPVVLIFATPALCQSRVCGPDVDVAEQVKAEVGDKVAFIHQEIYNDNQVSKGLRPQLIAWHLESEPWLFVIGRDGRIKDRIEGAVSVPELRAAVQKVM